MDEGRVAAHLAELRFRNLSPGTIYQRKRCLARLSTFLGTQSVLHASSAELLRFLDRRQLDGRHLAVNSQVAELAHLRSFFKWCVMNDVIPVDPTVKVPSPKLPKSMPHPMPEHDLARAIANAPPRICPWLYLAAYAGLRACEIAPLRGEDIWWSHDPASLHVVRGKGGDPGIVPIAPIMEPVLRALPRRGWCFPKVDGSSGHIMAHGVSQLSNRYLHRIGIMLTLHSLRHRFGTQVYRASGRDIRQTQELMRHKSPVSTAVYTQVDTSEAYGVVSALPG